MTSGWVLPQMTLPHCRSYGLCRCPDRERLLIDCYFIPLLPRNCQTTSHGVAAWVAEAAGAQFRADKANVPMLQFHVR